MEQLLETFGLLFAPKYGHTVDVNTIRKPVYLSTHLPPRKMAKISFLINRYEKIIVSVDNILPSSRPASPPSSDWHDLFFEASWIPRKSRSSVGLALTPSAFCTPSHVITNEQWDQIEQFFFKFRVDNFFNKVAKIFGKFLGRFKNIILSNTRCCS